MQKSECRMLKVQNGGPSSPRPSPLRLRCATTRLFSQTAPKHSGGGQGEGELIVRRGFSGDFTNYHALRLIPLRGTQPLSGGSGGKNEDGGWKIEDGSNTHRDGARTR